MIKRNAVVLVFLFALCLSVAVRAQSNSPIDFNVQNITTEFERFELESAKSSRNYESLVERLHTINILHAQVAECIQSSKSRLDKINQLFHAIDVLLVEKQSYNYLSAEKTRQEIQITNCSLINYRLDEIRETIVAQINTVGSNKLFIRTNSGWQDFNPSLLFNSSFNLNDLYQHSGFNQLSNTEWLSLALIWLYGLLMVLVLFKIGIKQLIKNHPNFGIIVNPVRHYFVFIFPLTLVVLYLHFIMRPINQSVTVVLFFDALLIFSVTLAMINWVLTLLVKGNPWPKAVSLFTTIIFWVTGLYVYVLDFAVSLPNTSLSHFINFQFITYCLVIARIAMALPASDKTCLSQNAALKIQKKFIISITVLFLGYIVSIILKIQGVPIQVITWITTAGIVFLNLTYIWLIPMILKMAVFKQSTPIMVQKTSLILLKSTALFSILMAAFGYHYLAVTLVPHLIVSAVVLLIIRDVNKLLGRFYFEISDPARGPSQKLRQWLGISTENKLVEVFILRLILTLPIMTMSAVSLMEIWGATRYYVTNVFMGTKAGFSILGATIHPPLIVRAVNVFCVIVLAGRALATHISHYKQFSGEEHSRLMIVSLVQYVTFVIAILFALYIAGVDLQGIFVLGGALTFGLGFALQNFARDFVGGLMIVFSKPIKIGDHVIVEFNRSVHGGYIKKIGALSTQLHTSENTDVIVPNSVIITNCVVNLTYQDNKNPMLDNQTGSCFNRSNTHSLKPKDEK